MQVQQRGRPMPFTEEQMRQIYNTNIIDFAVRNGFEIEKSDKARTEGAQIRCPKVFLC